jgi:tetratricopeptide (TPR) repeat protein
VCALLLLIAKLTLAAEPGPATPATDRHTPPPALADSLLRSARGHSDEKRFDIAASDLRRALAARPGDAAIWSLLARVLAWDHRYDASIEAYRGLLAEHPDDAFNRAGYARVLAWSGRHDEAIREFRRAAAADSTNPESRIGLARALAWSGDLPGAAMEYARLRRANPAYGDAWLGEASIARWRGAPTAADRFAMRAAALGADPSVLAEERAAIDRALAPTLTLGATTSHETQRASGAPDFEIEESGTFAAGRATLARAIGIGVRVARTQLSERNTRAAAGDTTLNYDLTNRSLRADASFLRHYPIQASLGADWHRFDARSTKVLYPLAGADDFTGWNARLWAHAGRITPTIAARRTFVALKGSDAATGALRFEPGHITDVEGALAWQWNARGTASLFAVRGSISDDNRRWRSGGTAAYRLRAGRPQVKADYAITFADWDFRSPSYFTPLASTRHAGGLSLSGYSEPGSVEYGARYELSRLASSNFEDIVTHAVSAHLGGVASGRVPLGIEAAWSSDNNDYKIWYAGLYGAVRW